jgi:hypothetical protein
MVIRTAIVALLAVVLTTGVVQAQGRELSLDSLPATLPLVDEGTRDPSLKNLRDSLIAAATAGDLKTVLDAVDPKVRVHQESPQAGIAELRREWEIDKSPSVFLKEVRAVLNLGGKMNPEGTEFLAPYLAMEFTTVDQDELGFYGVVVRENAPLYKKSDLKAAIVARLSFNIVGWYIDREGWVFVELRNGRSGYMRADDVRSPIATRIRFKKTPSGWRIVEFNRDYH